MKVSAICWFARSAWSLVKTGQPSTSVQPFWPVSRSIPSSPEAVSRKPWARALMLSAATLPSCRQTVPPSGFSLAASCGHHHAHQVVVGAEIGHPQVAVRLEEVRVDGHDGDVRRDLADAVGHGRGVRGRDGDGRHAARQEVVDDLDLAGLVAEEAGPV
jgi:hypothetical protein